MIKDSGDRAQAMLEDLLLLSKREISIQQPVAIAEVLCLYEVSQEFAALKKSHPRVSISISCQPDMPEISGSETHLNKLVSHLIANGVRAASESGGQVSVNAGTVAVSELGDGNGVFMPAGRYILFTVQDNGPGYRT